MNTIFYLAGFLSDCPSVFDKGDNVCDLIFNFQFKVSSSSSSFFSSYALNYDHGTFMEGNYYHRQGIKSLKSVNKHLEFASQEDYLRTIDSLLSLEEMKIIEESKIIDHTAFCIV